MLLFVRNPYYQAIKEGQKRYELRAGSRYSGIKPGDSLSINGRFRVVVTRVERFERAEEASRASSAAGWYLSVAAIRACYPVDRTMYLFHFLAPNVSTPNQTSSFAVEQVACPATQSAVSL